ncbi:MAG: hypothetical protein BWY59_01239 [Verrucomicrobia bacterium ADurb.Bin345]|nr:MAG: hypothetical protein BWY59_01239 [Verrucomicrobia bacterium ADurb.Bin345]
MARARLQCIVVLVDQRVNQLRLDGPDGVLVRRQDPGAAELSLPEPVYRGTSGLKGSAPVHRVDSESPGMERGGNHDFLAASRFQVEVVGEGPGEKPVVLLQRGGLRNIPAYQEAHDISLVEGRDAKRVGGRQRHVSGGPVQLCLATFGRLSEGHGMDWRNTSKLPRRIDLDGADGKKETARLRSVRAVGETVANPCGGFVRIAQRIGFNLQREGAKGPRHGRYGEPASLEFLANGSGIEGGIQPVPGEHIGGECAAAFGCLKVAILVQKAFGRIAGDAEHCPVHLSSAELLGILAGLSLGGSLFVELLRRGGLFGHHG